MKNKSIDFYIVWRACYSEPTRTRLDIQFLTTDADYLLSYNPMDAKVWLEKYEAEQAIKDFKLEEADATVLLIKPDFWKRIVKFFDNHSFIPEKIFNNYLKQQADENNK